ncbi:YihY/virulence factor BrkB family protein [Natronoglomus mannanivorans]|uniref:YihY/virulence factor BrkB family protein n=1 Tax=Natronoglomus mannanivorans TaxID=2979990 RepID=A0AAP3E396_9EURY|nr:YihY/virulence factor BrkB family protein [Halobacteria archaeon AArc-xg1-1]
MDRSREALIGFCYDIVAVSRERQLSVKSAGLAYHAFNTLVPLVILLLVGVTVVDALDAVLETLESLSGLDAAATQGALDEVTGDDGGASRLRATGLAFVILAWSGVRMFQAVNSTFTAVYGSRRSQSLVSAVTDVLLSSVTVVVAVALVTVVGVGLSFVIDGLWWHLLSPFLLFGLLVAAFLPMYYVYPQTDVTVREVLPGTAFAAGTWVVLGVSFRFYVATSDSVELYGIAGAVLIVLTWVYLGGLCVLLGAVGNAVLADRVEPDDGWIPLEETFFGRG